MAGVLGEAWGAVSLCVRGELPAFHLSVRDECDVPESWQCCGRAGQKSIFESNSKPQA